MEQYSELSRSQEDYLVVIQELTLQEGFARVRDIASHMEVAKSSVTVALRALSRAGLVNYAPYQLATLNEKGRVMAEKISRRHQTLRHFMVSVLGVAETVAATNACRIEHAIDDGVMNRLHCFVGFMSSSDITGKHLPIAFLEHCSLKNRSEHCEGCEVPRGSL